MPSMTAPFLDLVNLASQRLGAEVVLANDDFFGPKEQLIQDASPVASDGRLTDHGRWVDGWETRRRRDPGQDWCVVRLFGPGIVRGIDVDTTFFKGNHPEACALDGCELPGQPSAGDLLRATWRELLPRTALDPDAH